jgi:hypothetical protein
VAFADDLDRQGEDLSGPGDQLAGVAGIGPDQPDGREVAAKTPQQILHTAQHPTITRPVTVQGGVTDDRILGGASVV